MEDAELGSEWLSEVFGSEDGREDGESGASISIVVETVEGSRSVSPY